MNGSSEQDIIFVTGATGFIGSRIVQMILKQWKIHGNPNNAKIRLMSRSASSYVYYPQLQRLARENPNILEIFYGPLEDKQKVLEAMQGNIIYIYHSAAKGGDWGNKEEFWGSNVTGTENVLEGAIRLFKENKQNFKRFLHISTVDVYPPNIETKYCSEDTVITSKRRAWYSVTKAMAEQRVLKAHREHGLPVTIVRPAAVFGPGSWSFGFVEAKILKAEQGVLISGGNSPCGAIYVDDCVEHLLQASNSENTIGKIYNSSAYHDITWKMYYDAIADGIGCPRARWSIPLWFAKIVAWLMETVWWLRGCTERPYLTLFVLGLIGRPQLWPITASQRDFGWTPRFSFEKAMSKHCAWLRTQDLDF